MALINKTGIVDGATIQAEHVTRIIDALSAMSNDSIVATGSFTGSFTGDGSGLFNVQQIPIVVSSNTTAENDRVYHVVANATFTDPTPVEGKGFTVFVRNGTATVGSLSFTSGMLIIRTFHSGIWSNSSYSRSAVSNSTDESTANKSIDVNTDQASNTKYPSVKAVYDWATGLFNGTASFNSFTSSYATGSFTGSFIGNLTGTASFATTASHFTGAIGTGQYIPRWSGSSANSNTLIDSTLYQDTSGNILLGSTGVAGARLYISHSNNNGVSTVNISTNNATSFYSLNDGPGNFLQFQTGSAIIFNLPTNGAAVLTGSLRIVNPTTALSISGNSIMSGSLTVTGSQVIINRAGSKSSPSLYFTNDSNTGLYNRGLSDTLCVSTNGTETVRIAPSQLIVGNENFTSNNNYAQPGVMANGWIYGTDWLSQNVFFGSSQYGRGVGTIGGVIIGYRQTGSAIPAPDGEKIVFATLTSGSNSSDTGSASLPLRTAMRFDCNYDIGSGPEPNVEIANALTIGKVWFSDGSGTELQRNASGQVGLASSDIRLKTNIETITGSLNLIKSLNGVRYNWTSENEPEFIINNTGSQIGLIAQDVQQILPEIVKPNGVKDYLTVEYDKLVAVLIEAVKEQQQQIDSLQQQINALQS
jgi:hypothetical protein